MSSKEWATHKLGYLLGEKGYVRGPFGSSLKRGEMKSSGIPVYEQQHAIYNSRDFRFYIDEEKLKELKRFQVKANDLIVSCSGTIGKVSIIREEDPKGIISQALLILRPDNTKVLPEYLQYYFSTREGFNNLVSTSHGSVQINIAGRNIVEGIQLKVPNIPTQRRIVEILSALDEKIELNRQTNATLEAIAQSIFREWFVDGEDIDDWEVGKLGDIAENIRRSVQPSEIEPDTPYIGLEHMPRGSLALSEWDTASDVVSNKYLFKQDEFLFGKLRPYFHKVGVAPLDGVSSTDILVVAPKEDDYYGVVLGHISSVDLINHTTAASTGTKMPRTNWSDIARYQIALPPKERAKQFSGFMKSVIQLIQSNIMEARTLADIRDTLLPKLMSGEIEVTNS